MASTTTLNERAQRLADHMAATASALRIAVQQTPGRARIIDCGIQAPGGLQAGLALARLCDYQLPIGDIKLNAQKGFDGLFSLYVFWQAFLSISLETRSHGVIPCSSAR